MLLHRVSSSKKREGIKGACALSLAILLGLITMPQQRLLDHTYGPVAYPTKLNEIALLADKSLSVSATLNRQDAVTGPISAWAMGANTLDGVDTLTQGVVAYEREDTRTESVKKTQTNLTKYLTQGYGLKAQNATKIVEHAMELGKAHNVDPRLILSVAAIESSFNPLAQSSAGAQGLMQVHTKVHQDKFAVHGGVKAAFEPYANLSVGTQILKNYMDRTGSVKGALKWYVGAAQLSNDGGYGQKVMTEWSRVNEAADGNVKQAVQLLKRKESGPSLKTVQKLKRADYARFDGALRG